MAGEKPFFEKVVTSERIYDGRVIDVRKDVIELPNHRTATREVVEHPVQQPLFLCSRAKRFL